MILPTRADIVELAQNGTLLDAVFSDRWQCRYQHFEPMAQALAEAHNEGDIDLLGTLSSSGLEAFSGHKGYQGRRIYSLAIECLDTSVKALLPALKILATQAEGEAHEVAETLRLWCSASPSRPKELLALIDSKELNACERYSLSVAIRTGLNSDLPYFSDRAYSLIENGTPTERAQVIQALSSPPFSQDAEWRRALNVLRNSIAVESSDELRSALARTLLTFTESIPSLYARELEELIGQVSIPTTPNVAHHLAYALAFSFKTIAPPLRTSLLSLIGAIDLEPQTQKLIDLGLANLIKAGGADQVRTFIADLLLQPDPNFRFEDFDSTIRNLVEGPAQVFETWIVDWLRTAPYTLCKELNDGLFHDKEEYTFQLDFNQFDFAESEYGYIARRAIATFFMKPAIAASFLICLGRCSPHMSTRSDHEYIEQQSTTLADQPDASQNEQPESEKPSDVLSDLLFDPLLINYTNAQKHLQPIADDSNDKAAPIVKRALNRLKQYGDALEEVGFIAELQPSERERQLEGQRRSDFMNDAMRASRKNSPFAGIFAERILLYGNGMVTWIEDSLSPRDDGEQNEHQPRRMEQTLASISHSFELPREEILEPVGLQMKLLGIQSEEQPE